MRIPYDVILVFYSCFRIRSEEAIDSIFYYHEDVHDRSHTAITVLSNKLTEYNIIIIR